jgi:hypothetical protein
VWSVLFVTLPTKPNAVRLRLWRALKNLGCVSLRDGVFLLPAEQAAALDALAAEAIAHGGDASVFALAPRDAQQRAELLAQFDRSSGYAAWHADTAALQHTLESLGEAEARRRVRAAGESLDALRRIDYYPGAAGEQALATLDALRQAVDTHYASGEPKSAAGHDIQRLDPAHFQRKRWATRARPWVDRLACAWLIRRFIDVQARFVWLADPARAPSGVLGFDYDGARFSHVGPYVSFEVLMRSFGLDADARLQRIAATVHYLDVGGTPVAEAAGLEAVLAGLRELHADDDELLAAAGAVFDALHAAQRGDT